MFIKVLSVKYKTYNTSDVHVWGNMLIISYLNKYIDIEHFLRRCGSLLLDLSGKWTVYEKWIYLKEISQIYVG